jgi:hypothetical protein
LETEMPMKLARLSQRTATISSGRRRSEPHLDDADDAASDGALVNPF